VAPIPECLLRFDVQAEDGAHCESSIVIDSTVNGRSYGGLGLVREIDTESLGQVAHRKTLKSGLLGLPLGGAKAAIVAPPHATASQVARLLSLFGQAARPLLTTRRYSPSGELGLDDADVHCMLSDCGVRLPRHSLRGRSSLYTGLTVALASLAALRVAGVRLSGPTAAVEGFGKVGSATALALHERGVKVVAVSTDRGALFDADGLDVPDLVRRLGHHGSSFVSKHIDADRIPAEELRRLAVDVFCPCALPAGIDVAAVGQLRCRTLVAGANAPLQPGGEDVLVGKGVVYVPDIVASCGGMLGATLSFGGLSTSATLRFIEQRFPPLVEWLMGMAEHEGIPLHEFATRYAEERFVAAKREAERCQGRLSPFDLALRLYRRGLVPPALVRPFSTRAVAARLRPGNDTSYVALKWAHAAGR
jgi:glutamate dehydrogenase (NAD(P)+)